MYVGHAEMDSCSSVAESVHGFKLLGGGSHGGLDRGDLAEPALFLGLGKSGDEVGVDGLQPRDLSRVDPE